MNATSAGSGTAHPTGTSSSPGWAVTLSLDGSGTGAAPTEGASANSPTPAAARQHRTSRSITMPTLRTRSASTESPREVGPHSKLARTERGVRPRQGSGDAAATAQWSLETRVEVRSWRSAAWRFMPIRCASMPRSANFATTALSATTAEVSQIRASLQSISTRFTLTAS